MDLRTTVHKQKAAKQRKENVKKKNVNAQS